MDDESRHRQLERAREAETRRNDFHNEIADRDVGRIQRFLPETRSENRGKGRKRDEKALQSALRQLLASDPAYFALYENTLTALRQAEAATEHTREAAEALLQERQSTVDDLAGKAATLHDGRKVFRDRHGQVRDVTGRILESSELNDITWRGDEPSYEAWVTAQQALAQAQSKLDSILRYQTDTLGMIRNKITDEDNPPSADELRDMQQQMENQIHAALSSELPTPPKNQSTVEFSLGPIVLPEL